MMFRSNTVFITGAGSSNEFNLPLAGGLRDKLAEKLNLRVKGFNEHLSGDKVLLNLILEKRTEGAQGQARLIADALSQFPSIDAALNWHTEKTLGIELAKIAICRAILEGESSVPKSRDSEHGLLDLTQLRETWLAVLFPLLLQGTNELTDHSLLFKNVSFITFNYDRCIEKYFEDSLVHSCRFDRSSANRLVSSLPIFHVYGKIGELAEIPFGGKDTRYSSTNDWISMGQRIFTYSESEENEKRTATMKKILANASQLIFLGFSFQDENMELITKSCGENVKKIFATVQGLSNSETNIARSKLEQLGKDVNIIQVNGKGVDLLKSYHRELQFQL